MTDYTTIFNNAINLDNNETLLSRLLSEHRPLIASYLGDFNDQSWEKQQEEIAYLRSRHRQLGTKKIEQLIQQYSSTPSPDSLCCINGLLDEINSMIIEKKIEAIGIHGTYLNLDKAYISRLPVSLFQKERYVDFWKNLTHLNSKNNKLMILDLSALTALQALNCENNQLTMLNLKGLAALVFLNCNKNPLKVLNLTGVNAAVKDTHGWLERNLKFEQLKNADSDEARSIIIQSLGPDYTYANCLYYCPALATQLFFSGAKNTTLELITSIYTQAASFLPSFSENNNPNQDTRKRARDENGMNIDLDEPEKDADCEPEFKRHRHI